MASESSSSQDSALGCVFYLIVALVILVVFVYTKVSKSQTTGVVVLSAYFVDNSGNPVSADETNGHLKIKGYVHEVSGTPLDKGSVRLTVSKEDESFQQAVATGLQGGQFESQDDAFRSLQRADKIRVRADVSGSNWTIPATDEVFLNTSPPTLTSNSAFWVWLIAVLVVIGILFGFFMTFTGRRTPKKNRNAIIFSYLFGGVFLAVPLIAPVLLLQFFPNLRKAMIGAPAGLVLTRVANDNKIQWALNIGGYSRTVSSVPSPTPTPTPTPTPGPTPVVGARPTPTPTPTPTPVQNQTSTATPSAGTSPQAQSTPSPRGATSPSASREIAAREEKESDNSEGIVEVEGGLVIPLYVIMLSVIGGAINMIRKVPQFQSEGEYSEATGLPYVGFWAWIRKVATAISNWKWVRWIFSRLGLNSEAPPPAKTRQQIEAETTSPETPTSESSNVPPEGEQRAPSQESESSGAVLRDPKVVDDDLDVLVRKQIETNSKSREAIGKIRTHLQEMKKIFDKRKEDERILGFESFEAWLGSRVSLKEVLGSNWRVELLNQYMYLISAPFLAIVAYYILDLLSLTKQPILVLISFSVGLISERILTWILGIASGYLRGDSKSQTAGS